LNSQAVAQLWVNRVLPDKNAPLYSSRQMSAARESLLNFTRLTYPTYVAEAPHELITQKLDGVVAGEIKRLMIFMPPQHGKSELVSIRLPAYWLGKRPDDPVILTSYSASLAHKNSRAARDIVESDLYKSIFPGVETRKDSRAVDRWQLKGRRGSVLAAGADGPLTGNGGLLGVIDDPFQNWETAQSATMRQKVWEWWRGTFRTRIWEHGAIVLLMTRWHEDDIAGRLLNSQGDQWEVLRLPAIAETQQERDENAKRMKMPIGDPDPLGRDAGQPLAPKRYSLSALEAIKTDSGSMVWGSEYQAAPRAAEGNRIKRAWFEIVEAIPAGGRFMRYWDKAGTEGGGAYTAGVLICEYKKVFYIVDVQRAQLSAMERENLIKQTAHLDRQRYGQFPIYIEQEPGSSGKESAQATIRNLVGFVVRADPPSGDKDVRLHPFEVQAEAGNVRLLRGAWNFDYLEELTAIPNGTYRDQADATSGAFNKLIRRGDGGTL
jgi:predicted phage terminase large subunit-like protein